MKKKFKINLSEEQVYRYIDGAVVVTLAVLQIILCTQFVTAGSGHWLRLALLVSCCVLLDISCAVTAFGVKKFKLQCIFYGVDFACLLAICLITGNSWLVTLYCVVLTQVYISSDRFRSSIVIFSVSCVAYVISFVCGWVIANRGADIYTTTVQTLGGCILGLIVLASHLVVAQFTLKFYRTNLRLTAALKEADESRERLREAYKKLSETAVFEERNRIAKDIHDNAGHSMTTVIMQTEAAKLLIDTDPEEAKNRIISANIQAKNALDQMRVSVHLLAGRRGNGSLKEEIEEIVAQFIDGTDIKIRCDLSEVSAGEEVGRFLCDSFKECLANGVRHGRATAFYAELRESGGEISFLVSDNGLGTEGDVREGFGLRSMKNRAAELGGTTVFSAESGEGFEVKIKVPAGTAPQAKEGKE